MTVAPGNAPSVCCNPIRHSSFVIRHWSNDDRHAHRAARAAGELERGPFSMRDLRRTAETHMAALGVSSDVRAQIQSHGLGGIQARHYDRHDYMPEKRAARALWAQRFRNLPRAPRQTPPRTKSLRVGERVAGQGVLAG